MNVPESQLKVYIDQIFDRYDRDRSGNLDASELANFFNDLFKAIGNPTTISMKDAQNAIRAIDKNNDGKANKLELFMAFKNISSQNGGPQQSPGGYQNPQQNPYQQNPYQQNPYQQNPYQSANNYGPPQGYNQYNQPQGYQQPNQGYGQQGGYGQPQQGGWGQQGGMNQGGWGQPQQSWGQPQQGWGQPQQQPGWGQQQQQTPQWGQGW